MKPIRVALVDDHALLRESITLLLQTDPAISVVGTAGNGNDAVDMLMREKPDVALLDIEMPGRTCFEVISLTRDLLPNTRFVILSATWGDHFIQMARSVEVAAYVLKTEGAEQIKKVVHLVAAGKHYFSQEINDRMINVEASRSIFTDTATPLDMLSNREKEVLIHLAKGLSIKEVAGVLNLSRKTVDNHTQNLMNKLDIHNRADLVRYAIRERLVHV
jgi:DNA-binding NarL/FixJ family response regulator